MMASMYGHPATVMVLLKYGAEVDHFEKVREWVVSAQQIKPLPLYVR